MRLSLCCLTRDPAERVAVALKPFRALADEVVIGFDDRVRPLVAKQYAELADRLVPVKFELLERHLERLHAACSGDWILRVDADEAPSAALCALLPALLTDPEIRQYRIPRRWLYPDREHWIGELPWWPDFQIRLVRNDASLEFSGQQHTSAKPALPARYLEAPLYHLDCLIGSPQARTEKARRYEARQPGPRLGSGLSVNAAYLPERYVTGRPESVPAADLPYIDALLMVNGAPHEDQSPPKPPSRVERRARGGFPPPVASARSQEPSLHADAVIEPFERDHRMLVGQRWTTYFRVTNRSAQPWPGRDQSGPLIRLSYRWKRDEATAAAAEGDRTAFPCTVAPGGQEVVPLDVVAPSRPGRWILETDVVAEGVRWYDCPCRVPVEVGRRPASAPRVVFMGGWSSYRHVGDDAILRAHLNELPRHVAGAEPVVLADVPDAVAPRFGVPATSAVNAYLLEGLTARTPRGRALALLARRTVRLLRHARALRRGRDPMSLHPVADELLATLSSAQLLVGASAGSLASRFSLAALWPQAVTALAARTLGVPVVLSGVGIGPLEGFADRLIAGLMFHCATQISVRDPSASASELRRLGVGAGKVRRGLDSSAALRPASASSVDGALTRAGIPPAQPYAVVSAQHGLGLADIAEPLAAACDALSERYGLSLVFIPMVTGGDLDERQSAEHIERLRRSSGAWHVLDPLPTEEVLLGIVGRAAIGVGPHYHLAFFCLRQGVPSIALCGDAYADRRLGGLSELAGDLVSPFPASVQTPALLDAIERQLRRGRATAPAPDPVALAQAFDRLTRSDDGAQRFAAPAAAG
ncbi:MAG TPA: polysaccharide pyruvyl transferase family protein [Solirubrobacteraceae bacterium]|nr:polysaccharide pyruvyl transferase family protein [Solirubrobacteraceae bacterium]